VARLGDSRPPSVTVRGVSGLPAEAIIDAAKDADMIVVGSRGAGGFARLLMGSVSYQVAHHAHVPVLIVPPADRKP
jgi:nucleotide-binding universal stress UspA family protein